VISADKLFMQKIPIKTVNMVGGTFSDSHVRACL